MVQWSFPANKTHSSWFHGIYTKLLPGAIPLDFTQYLQQFIELKVPNKLLTKLHWETVEAAIIKTNVLDYCAGSINR